MRRGRKAHGVTFGNIQNAEEAYLDDREEVTSIHEVERGELEAAKASDEEVAPVLEWFENNKASSMIKV